MFVSFGLVVCGWMNAGSGSGSELLCPEERMDDGWMDMEWVNHVL